MTKAVLAIADMPRRLRAEVESAMVEFLPTPADIPAYDEDGIFTRWNTSSKRGLIGCKQTLGAEETELQQFLQHLEKMAARHGFNVAVTY